MPSAVLLYRCFVFIVIACTVSDSQVSFRKVYEKYMEQYYPSFYVEVQDDSVFYSWLLESYNEQLATKKLWTENAPQGMRNTRLI